MKTVLFTSIFTLFILGDLIGQDVDSLQARQADLTSEIDQLKSELTQTTKLIPPTFGWKKGFSGLLGFSLTEMNNWVSSPNPNSTTSTIQASFSGFVNLLEEKYFWRNSSQVNLGWQKLDLKRDDVEDESSYQLTVDVIQLTSHYGYNLVEDLAISALGELRTTLVEDSFDPAFLDLGIGGTWTPMQNLVVVVHPLNYNFIFSSDDSEFESSLGAKVIVDYRQQIIEGFNLRTHLTGFVSYEDADELSNYTWTTGVNFNAFKGIGVGIEYALRWNKQETQMMDDDLQSYFLLGLSYGF